MEYNLSLLLDGYLNVNQSCRYRMKRVETKDPSLMNCVTKMTMESQYRALVTLVSDIVGVSSCQQQQSGHFDDWGVNVP